MKTSISSTSISLENRVLGGWWGKSAGGTLGLPAEGRTERQYFSFYDPVPKVVPPNDDLELQLVWLDRMENHRGPLTVEAMAGAWLDHIHYMWDEYGRCRWNLRRGVPSALAGIFENPFASSMGSPIRSEIWAIVAAGDVDLAEKFARLDAMLDHGAEGIAGEVFFTVLQTLVLSGTPLQDALEEALRRTDGATETRHGLELVQTLHRKGTECWETHKMLLRAHRNDNFTHAPLNVALTLWALLYGNGDFGETILLGVNGGYDTDCTAATAGATLGFFYGADGLPKKWTVPLGDGIAIGEGIIGIKAPTTLGQLTERSLDLRARAEELAPVLPKMPERVPALASLPGTISITSGNATVDWANGELPPEIKASGRAAWEWKPGAEKGKPFQLLALAREGVRLWIDGKLLVECPADVPFIPATHRSPKESAAVFIPSKESHEVRVELNSANPWQEASILLADASLHIAPWNGEVLPHRPQIADSLSAAVENISLLQDSSLNGP